MKKMIVLLLAFCVSIVSADTFEDGGNRLLGLQNDDGGWDWPLDNGDPATGSANNTAAPIAMGLLAAYEQTGDSAYLAGAVEAGEFIKAVSPPHSTGNGIFMSELSKVTGDASYVADVKSEFYDALEGGVYDKDGTDYGITGYADYIIGRRSGGYTDLAAWDIGLAAAGAVKVGCDQSVLTDWADALDSGLESWEYEYGSAAGSSYYNVLGLAGGVYGFAALGQETLDLTGCDLETIGITSLTELADLLASYQTESGGFSKYSQYVNSLYAGAQATSYAILALSEVDSVKYASQISKAAQWLMDIQLSTGGWSGAWEGIGSENNEITGEALWATSVAVPAPGAILLAGLGTACVGRIRRRIR